jgi:hypothetical protein
MLAATPAFFQKAAGTDFTGGGGGFFSIWNLCSFVDGYKFFVYTLIFIVTETSSGVTKKLNKSVPK